MKTAKISLNSIDKVKAFVNEISKFDCDFDLEVPGNLMTEWFLEISWQLITPETEWLGIIS